MRPLSPGRKLPPNFELFIKESQTHGTSPLGKTFTKTSRARWLRGSCHTCGTIFERPLKRFDNTGTPAYCGYDCMWKRESASRPTRDNPISRATLNLEVARILKTTSHANCSKCGQNQPIGSVCLVDHEHTWCWDCYDSLVQSEYGTD